MGKLKPLDIAPTPAYPVRWRRDGSGCAALRKAAATTTATLALCLTACDPGEEPTGAEQGVAGGDVAAEQADAGERAAPQPDAGRGNDPLMNGQTAGMPLALGLDGEERAPTPPPGNDGIITPPATPPVVPVPPAPQVPPGIHVPPPPPPPVVVTPEPPKPPTQVVPQNYPIRPAGGPRIIRRPGRRSGG